MVNHEYPILVTMIDAHSFGRYARIRIAIASMKDAYIFVGELAPTFMMYNECND